MKFNKWGSLPFCLAGLCMVAVSSSIASAQTSTGSAPAFPKYKIMGVVYAPPGSASSVTYGNSNMVGSTDTMSFSSSNTNTVSTSVSAEAGIPVFSAKITYDFSDSWTESNEYINSIAIQTTTGNSISTMGPISSSLGVDHDNDVIYIWLNPVLTGSTSGSLLTWTGLESNSCDPDNSANPLTVDQAVNGCDPNQYPYPDIVGIPVWCLKNPYYPGQGCAQWIKYTARSWDTSSWGTDPNTGLPLGPGLTMRDFADILQADPFVTLNGNAVNVCHPTYGPALDPNLPETIGAALTPTSGVAYSSGGSTSLINYADPYDLNYNNFTVTSGSTASTGFFPQTCGSKNTTGTMNRFQPYGVVEYPVPGPNGLPSTYTGTFQYSETQTQTTVATDTHTVSQGVTVSAEGGTSNFNVAASAGYSNSTTWTQQSSVANTNEATASASYSITGPQLSDNYTGPATYNVYMDNVYNTFAFYSDMESVVTPAQLGNIGISISSAGCSAASSAVCITFAPTEVSATAGQYYSAEKVITLTNNSSYPVTMAGPAISFSDPGFQTGNNLLGDGSDGCSNLYLPAGQSCNISVLFSPMTSDMPNPVAGVNVPVTANMVAAGTVNADPYQNILSSNYARVTGTATPPATALWATLLPTGTATSNVSNAYIFPGTYTYGANLATTSEAFTFTNKSTSIVTVNSASNTPKGVSLTDATDFKETDNCAGNPINPGSTCTVTVTFYPGGFAPSGTFATRITVNGTAGASPVQAIAGATVNAVTPAFSVTQSLYETSSTPGQVLIPLNGGEQTDSGGECCDGAYGWAVPITITNNTGATLTFAQNLTPTSINESSNRDDVFICEEDAGTTTYNDIYFSPCVYQTSTITTTPETEGSLVTSTPLPAPWGYVFGQLGGTAGGYVYGPAYGDGPMQSTASNSPHAYSSGNDSIGNSWTSPTLLCGTTLTAGSSCTAAVVAFIPPGPDDQPWDSIVFDFNTPTFIPLNSFVSNFTLPISATFPAGSYGTFSYGLNIPVVVDGQYTTPSGAIPPGTTTQVVSISGTEQSTATTVPATAATASLTVQSVSTAVVASASTAGGPAPAASGPAPATGSPSAKLTLAVKVGSFQTTVQTPAGSTAATVAQAVAKALTVLGSPVKATASGAVVTMTSYTKGSAANVAFTVTGNADFTVASSGSALAGGKNATTSTKYDAGLVNLTTNGVTASAQWGEGSTPATVAQALAASVNTVASAYWTATASGDVVTLTGVSSSSAAKGKSPVTLAASIKSSVSKTANTAAAPSVVVTTSDTAGFTPASFGAATN